MSFDQDAPDLATANTMVVKDFQNYLEKMKTVRAPVPPGATKAIIEKVLNSSYLTNFHRNLTDRIVQVDFSLSGTIVQGTSVNCVGDTWRLKFTIDADVPPTGSKQKPHIGYEISLDGAKKQVGHKFCNSLSIGRPGLGVNLIKHDGEDSSMILPNGDTMEWAFVRWRVQ
ncbi:hypothetical protein I4U23_004474 [Adineta vaga]|nr:hypothetical protein I4U23_004474 [Adineta vaga]